MAKKKKKTARFQQLLIVGGMLAAVQVVYIFILPHDQPVSPQEAIQAQLDKQSIDSRRKEQLRVQLSVTDFKQKNNRLPENLDELIPVYFESVPLVPGTTDPFQYLVKDGKYYIDDKAGIANIVGNGSNLPVIKGGSVYLLSDNAAPLPPAVQNALIESLKDQGQLYQVSTIYDPTGKRDPFRPFDFAPKVTEDSTKTPLERYDVNQLKLTAVISSADGGVPAATVENTSGKGFIVKKGVKIGLNGGEVVDIKQDRIIVVETTTDFTGQKKNKTIELKLRTKDQDDVRGKKTT